VLPRDPRTSKDIIAYFVEEGRVQEALDAGVTYAGGAELIPKVGERLLANTSQKSNHLL
jgi:hypothetical protein